MKWIIIDEKGRVRLAKPNEIMSQPLIDDSEVSLEDGDLIFPSSEVNENEKTNERKSKNRKRNPKI